MKKAKILYASLICLSLASCNNISQSVPEDNTTSALQSNRISEAIPISAALPTESTFDELEQISYRKAYTEFILTKNSDEGDNEFPIRGYYLLDLNFDRIPELGVYHDSEGSMGGYFHFYYFNGNKISVILNSQNEPARISDSAQILADYEHKKLYFYKEMYLLVGNENAAYGYVRELLSYSGIPRVNDVLKLNVNEDINLLQYEKTNYEEDDYLSDSELNDCLTAQYYSDNKWSNISPDEYRKLKRERIPLENSFIDLRITDVYLLKTAEEETETEEIDDLFLKWLDYVK